MPNVPDISSLSCELLVRVAGLKGEEAMVAQAILNFLRVNSQLDSEAYRLRLEALHVVATTEPEQRVVISLPSKSPIGFCPR